ncbi:ABC transporter permease subunit [Bacillus tropicus]|uniref:ABC transporter permease subunit n=1 Tax=Bacillus tropicus TaxID=2026188 RepID=UPI000B4B7867|nr:ABC transporter permease subunit [Bacillus tropicus]MDF9558046.1 ABC transporter permease subunit [Bacillus tropicus]MDF9589387.1 ABC transporter permease subunit [Bacillus tropicus]MDF9647763.1 ABC transporter permease subunit [Bacillus tropicus]HDR7798541.1 ABC transporter permease subunit [Bacillus tropicus]
MNNSIVLIKKEYVQMLRDFKIIWLPIVFIFLGATQPIVTHYLPSILEALGGGSGIVIDPSMAVQKGGEVLASTLGAQFDQLGLMILVISMMGTIQTDKANGMLAFILTRPVTVTSYVGGKIVANYLMVACSVTIGYVTSYLYVNFLFSAVPFAHLITGLLLYLIWILFIVSFTTMISAIFHSQGMIALIAIVFLLACRVMVGLNPIMDLLNPASMSKYAMETLVTGGVHSNAIITAGVLTIVWILLTLFVTYYWIANKKFHYE